MAGNEVVVAHEMCPIYFNGRYGVEGELGSVGYL